MADDSIDQDDGKLATDTDGILAELQKRVQWSIDFDSGHARRGAGRSMVSCKRGNSGQINGGARESLSRGHV